MSPPDTVTLEGNLILPEGADAVVLFAHGSGSGRHSPRNRHVARVLNEAKLATLLIDLLTSEEEEIDQHTAHLRFDIDLLARRLVHATDWLTLQHRYTAPSTWLFRRQHRRRGRALWQQPSCPTWSVPSSRAADGRIWQGRPCRAFAPPRSSSSAATMHR